MMLMLMMMMLAAVITATAGVVEVIASEIVSFI